MSKLKYICILAMSALLLAGCAQKKKVATAPKPTTTTEQTVTTPVPPEQKTDTVKLETPKPKKETVVEKAIKAQPNCSSIQAQKVKFTINYAERQISSSGSISLIKDSILIISVQPLLNIELVRAEVTPSDIIFIDKMNKRYVQMSYADLKKQTGFDVTFADIQAIAMDRMFILSQEQSVLTNDQVQITTKNGQTNAKLTDNKLDYSFMLDDTTLALLTTTIGISGKTDRATIVYSGHAKQSGVLFPNKVDVTLKSASLSGKVSISFPSVVINGNVNATRAKTSNLSKTSLNAIIQGK